MTLQEAEQLVIIMENQLAAQAPVIAAAVAEACESHDEWYCPRQCCKAVAIYLAWLAKNPHLTYMRTVTV